MKINYTNYDEEMSIPAKYDVCPICEGKGSHVNPSIDGNGLTDSDFAEDPDFKEAYFNGLYDVPCHECDGKRVVLVPDEGKATEGELADYWGWIDAEVAYANEVAMERRYGA